MCCILIVFWGVHVCRIPLNIQRARFADALAVFVSTLSAHEEAATSMVKSVWTDLYMPIYMSCCLLCFMIIVALYYD